MLSASLLVFALLQPPPIGETCPEGARIEGYAPPDGDAWACVLHDTGADPIRHGWSVEYWPNGSIKLALEYAHGEPHGRFSRWSMTGQLVARGHYEGGRQIGYWWYWGALELGLYDPDGAVARTFAEALLEKVGVDEADARALAEHLFERHADAHADIRDALQVCTPSACVSAATIEGRTALAVQLEPPVDKVDATQTEVARLAAQSKAAHATIARERKRRDKEYARAKQRYDQNLRSWNYTRLQCVDGTRSPSCICGGSERGCCSHHGGVAGCPRDLPTAPSPDTSPLVSNELAGGS